MLTTFLSANFCRIADHRIFTDRFHHKSSFRGAKSPFSTIFRPRTTLKNGRNRAFSEPFAHQLSCKNVIFVIT